jgi:hypothetical protein
MSQSAKKRPTPPTESSIRPEDGSGRFVIAHRADLMLPPPGGQADEVLSLDAIGGFELPDAIDSTPPPAPNSVSGVFASGEGPRSDAQSDALAEGIGSMRPYYTANEQQSERAELIVEDLSLSFDNPYAASSLVPPPKKPLPIGRILGVAAALIAIGAGAWFAGRTFESVQNQHAAVVTVAPHVVAAPAPVVAVAPAAKIEAQLAVATPEPVEVAAPEAAKAAPVASIPTHERSAQLPAAHHESGSVEAALSAVLKNGAAEPAAPAPAAEPVAQTAAAAPAAPEPTPAATLAEPAAVATDALGALPDLPTREEIVAGFEQARAAIDTCAAGKHGTVKIQATIANSGRVASALVDGVFGGTPEGSCIARAVRAARFPQFSQASLKVNYPIAL